MKKVILKELTVSNFKGVNAHHVFGDSENRVSGKNASGKTTIMRAFYWLLTGYSDANTPMNSRLFDDKEELTPQTPKASVTAVVTVDGETHTLERTATAAFTRKRGTTEAVKSPSDTYTYKIDNLEVNATDYREWLTGNIADESLLCYCLDGSFFVNLMTEDKRKARTLIEKVVGTVDDSEMKGDYSGIADLLGKYSPEDIEKMSADMAKSVSRRLDEIPALLSVSEKEISAIEQNDFVANDKEIERLEKEREDCDRQMLDLAERMRPVLEAKAKAEGDRAMKVEVYKKAEAEYQRGWIEQDNALCAEISKTEAANKAKQAEKAHLMEAQDADRIVVEDYEETIEKLREDKEAVKNEKFDCEDRCPVCGAPLSEETKERERKAFEERQKNKLAGIVTRGKDLRTWIESLTERMKKRQAEIDTITETDTKPLYDRLSDLRTKDIMPFAATEQGRTLQADIDAVVVPEANMPEDREIKERKDGINNALVPLYELRGLKSRAESLKKGMEVLRSEQKEKGSELAKYERQRALAKAYKQEQIEILGHKVNDNLKCSSIEVWSKQKDGQTIPDLVLKDKNSVNILTTNNASRIATVCDIQRFFCEKLGVNMPTFVDESSVISSGNLPVWDDTQMFYLFCSDAGLKIESK